MSRLEARCKEMRRITNNYTVNESTCPDLRELFQELEELEADLTEHIRLENEILHPRTRRLEAECTSTGSAPQR